MVAHQQTLSATLPTKRKSPSSPSTHSFSGMLPFARTAAPPRPGTHEKSRSIDQRPSFRPCHHVPSPSRARRLVSSFARYISLMLVALVVFCMTIMVLDYVSLFDARPYTVAGRLNTDWSRHIYAPSITRSQLTFSNVWPEEKIQAWDTIERVHTPEGRPRASLDANGRMVYLYPDGSRITPLTPLGTAADGAFKNLIYDRLEYMTTLENFLRHNFPQEDSDEQATRSLINDMRVFFPLVKSLLNQWGSPKPRIPPKVYQNAPMKSEMLRPDYVDTRAEWRDLIGWTMKAFVYGRSKMGEWVKERFDLNAGTDHGTEYEADVDYEEPGMDDLPYERMLKRVVPDPTRNVVTTYEALTTDQAKSDLWQILIILTSGGVYTPFNYRPTRKPREWGLWPTTGKACIARSNSCKDPGLIAGVGFVAQDRNWRKRASRPIMLTPNYLGARRGHPVLVDTVRRVQLAILNNEAGPKSPISVASHFTDAMINWMLVRHRLAWSELLEMSEKGWRYRGEREWGDVKLVPVEGFGR